MKFQVNRRPRLEIRNNEPTKRKPRHTLNGIGEEKDFLSRKPCDQELSLIMDKQDFIKLKGFSMAKETIKLIENSQNGKESLTAIHLTQDIQSVYTELKRQKGKKINGPFKTWAWNLNRGLSKAEK